MVCQKRFLPSFSRLARTDARSMKFLSFIDYSYVCVLPMARVATRQASYLVLLHQLPAHGDLVRGRSIDRIENVLLRPDVALRMLMTINAPPHVQCVPPPGDGHLSKLSVARRAANPFVDMNAVVEVHKIGKGVYPVPEDGVAGSVTGPHRRQHVGVSPKLRVAGHASVRRRDAREPGRLNGRVAVTVIDPKLCCVVLVAEGNRLGYRTINICKVRRLIDLPTHVANERNNQNDAIDAGPGHGVHAAMKNLRHFESPKSKPVEPQTSVIRLWVYELRPRPSRPLLSTDSTMKPNNIHDR